MANDQTTTTPEADDASVSGSSVGSQVRCPQCGHEHGVEIVATVPSSQRITMTIESESTLFEADGIGEMISAQSKILTETARCLGTKVCVFVGAIDLREYRIRIEFQVVAVR